MDPRGNDNSNSNRDPHHQDRREVQRRLRLVRVGDQQLQRGAARFRTLRRGGEQGSNVEARPEEAPSSMGNRRSRTEGAGDPPAAANAGAVARNREDGSNSNEEDGGAADDSSNPKLRELIQHLREFCHDGDRKSPHTSAINMEKARNVLEACAGNVALAGQLYWDDYFASQQQQQQQPNPPPLDAPSAAAAAAPAAAAAAPPPEEEDEERRVRRRLESDFERLLPQPENNSSNNDPPPAEPAAAAAAARPARRRRRRRRGGPEAPAPEGGGEVRNNVEEDVPMADAEPPARPAAAGAAAPPPQRRPPDNQALLVAARAVLGAGDDAGEGSVSVSDDEAGVAGVLRMVRESGRARLRAGRRRLRTSSVDGDADEPGYIRAREALTAQIQAADEEEPMVFERTKKRKASGAGGGDGGDDDDSGDDDSKKGGKKNSNDNESDDDDGYLSDNDWLFTASSRTPAASSVPTTTATSQPMENLRAPLSVLWNGLSASPDTAGKKKKKDDSKKDKDEASGRKEKSGKKSKSEAKKDEGDRDNDDDDDTNNQLPGANKRPEIPSTWLHASFSPHSTAMGLAVKDPKTEDVAEHSWRLQQISNEGSGGNNRRNNNNSIPLPYHCRGMTAILSVVTAAIYTGASVQSNQVTCSSSRVPFLELSEELRKREFESRLIDALSSLIFIAAKASMERKRKALAKRQDRKNRKRKRQTKKDRGEGEDTPLQENNQKSLQRKLKLCPVVWWKENQQNSPILPAEQWENSLDGDATHTGPRIQVSITYGTNMEDVRAFVLSNMQSFTSPGGLALLLETIVGIHGEGAVKRMLSKSAGCKDHPRFLVRCTCEARQRKWLQDSSLSPAAKRKLTNSLDTTPPGHQCVSTELISLLCTGKVHSSLQGWTSPLGFGFLTNKPGEVGRALSRPELPVWCLRGETCYSTLLLDHTNHGDNLDETAVTSTSTANGKDKAGGKKKSWSPAKPRAAPSMKIALCSSTSRSRDMQEARAFAREDQSGYIANMAHWNPWYGLRNLSRLRLITARNQWSPPEPSWIISNYKSAPDLKPVDSLTCSRKSVVEQLRERRLSQANVVSSDERESANMDQHVNEAAMDRVRLHPDDAKFYPKQHRLWRFDMGERQGARVDPNSKPRGDHWVPYHSLSREEQMIVETKFGPQINRILWTRWPGSNIDKFAPEGKKEPLPVV